MQIQWTWLGWGETEREGDKERGRERERAVFSPGCIYEHKKLAPAHLPHLHTQSNSFTVVLVGTLTLSPSPSLSHTTVSFCCVPATFKGKAKQWGPKTSTDNRAAASDFSCFFTIFLLFFSCSWKIVQLIKKRLAGLAFLSHLCTEN